MKEYITVTISVISAVTIAEQEELISTLREYCCFLVNTQKGAYFAPFPIKNTPTQ